MTKFENLKMVEDTNSKKNIAAAAAALSSSDDENYDEIPPDQLSAIDDMLMKLLAADPNLTPDQLTPEMLAMLDLPSPSDI